jgi:hypothetical protein
MASQGLFLGTGTPILHMFREASWFNHFLFFHFHTISAITLIVACYATYVYFDFLVISDCSLRSVWVGHVFKLKVHLVDISGYRLGGGWFGKFLCFHFQTI